MENQITKERLRSDIEEKLLRYFGTSDIREASREQLFSAVLLTVKDILARKRGEYKKLTRDKKAKRVYYLCMEFLVGRSLKNNIFNLGLERQIRDILSSTEHSIEELYEYEPDAALGNGGLGRLAACYMDALTTLGYPATGFSILYEYGLFKQVLVNGEQLELPDKWMPRAGQWLIPRTDKTCTVRFGGRIIENWNNGRCEITHLDPEEIQAVPYDLLISGSESGAVNTLRLWKAHSNIDLNMDLFSQGQYIKAMEESKNADIISKVLYPSDNHTEGKMLRLSQQYFLVSASLHSIISDHLATYGTLENFGDKVAIHINDTHPALIIPELMRVLIDTYSYSWESAWDTVCSVITYTNHTVMPEALESWNEHLFELRLPRIYMIVKEINRRLCEELWQKYPGDWDRISRMSIIRSGEIKMANLCVYAAHTVNGVSELHSGILRDLVFHDHCKFRPDKYTNVTNGIAHRRWLCQANEGLCDLLDATIGMGYRKDASQLSAFEEYKNDTGVLDELSNIKRQNKVRFCDRLYKKSGKKLDPDSIFDVQIKRLHEYKRQLLNVLRIISLYVDLKNDPKLDIYPQTFIFAAKAAQNYRMAKEIIKLISFIEQDIEKDQRLKRKLNVVFVEDYNVSVAEMLIPAADISEQISLAGKEASGTGNMKMMMNGALTIGTPDGANIEIADRVGSYNIYTFGHTTHEVDSLWRSGYHSSIYYNNCEKLRSAVDHFHVGFNGKPFDRFVDYFLTGNHIPDPFMCLADFDSYYRVHAKMNDDYLDSRTWNKKCLVNIARSGIFSADRSINEYAEKIWHITPVTKE